MKRLLMILLLAISSCSAAPYRKGGFPVFGLLRQHTYDVEWGTAFMVEWKDRRYLVSNWHVCRHQTKFTAQNADRKFKGSAEVIALFPSEDLCLLTPVATDGLKPSKSVPNGYPVYTGGFPAGSPNKIRLSAGVTTVRSRTKLDFGKGECPEGYKPKFYKSGKIKECWGTFLLQDSTMAGKEGRSGSPVVNAKGELVGIVNSKNGGTSSYILVEKLIRILKSLETK